MSCILNKLHVHMSFEISCSDDLSIGAFTAAITKLDLTIHFYSDCIAIFEQDTR